MVKMKNVTGIKIDIWRCFYVLWRQRILIVFVAIAMFSVSWLFTRGGRENIYSSSSTVYSTAGGGYNIKEAQETVTVMRQYSEVATSMKVLNQAAAMIGGESLSGARLAQMISVSFTKDSSIITIQARSSSPALCVSVANAVASSFVSEISAITGQNTVRVLDVAVGYSIVQSGRTVVWMTRMVLTALAVMVTCGVILLRDILSQRIHSIESASLDGELKILGVIPNFDNMQRSRPIEKL
jgi:capsular polysaccharide biosynthesis protein